MKNRENKILELLIQNKKVEVSKLSSILKVSQVTIRKDLDLLESKGIIKREYGYAHLRNDDDLNSRLAYHYETKKLIAKEAAKLVKDGDTIMIENGSCCALLAEELSNTKKDLTIITNSSFIASYIRNNNNFQIILLGGIYQKDSQVNVGPMITQCCKNFLVDLFFIGTDGYDENHGFTNRDQLRAQAVSDMSKQTNNIIILTESEKFSKRGIVPLDIDENKLSIITDNSISKENKENLVSKNIKVTLINK